MEYSKKEIRIILILSLLAFFSSACINQKPSPSEEIGNTPVENIEKTEDRILDLVGVWKTEDVHSPDNSWNIPYAVYLRFTATRLYVYHGIDAYNNNQPTDEGDIIFKDKNIFIRHITSFSEHPELEETFSKWSWCIDHETVSFTVYRNLESQDESLHDNTVHALFTGTRVE